MTSGSEARRAARAQAERALSERVLQLVRHVAPTLARFDSGAGLDERQLATILGRLESDGSLVRIKQARRILRRTLEELGRKTQGSVALPAPELMLARPASPFRPDAFRQVPQLSRLVTAFLKEVETEPQRGSIEMAATILFSAVVFGGLLHSTLVDALPLAFADRFHVSDDECWLDIEIEAATDSQPARYRRWFPDPITTCLMARWKRDQLVWPTDGAGSAKSLLRGLLDRLCRETGASGIKSSTQLLAAAQTRMRTILPGVLVDFLASVDRGQSLSPASWWRLNARWICNESSLKEDPDEVASELCRSSEPPGFEAVAFSSDSSGDLRSLNLLKKALKRDGKFLKAAPGEDSVAAFRLQSTQRGPMLSALIDWTLWQLQRLATGGRRAKPASVYRYLNWFAKPLIAHAGELDVAKAGAEQTGRKYREILESIRSGKGRQRAAGLLRNFHGFLMMTRDVEPVAIDGEYSARAEVRINYISELEYQRALGSIGQCAPGERSKCQMRLLLILGYRLGPRRNELAYIQWRDLQGLDGKRPLLWIHSHRESTLKTASSVRRLPLSHLLEPTELQELREWAQRRRLEFVGEPPRDALLFSGLGRDTQRIDDQEVDRVVEVLRHVCQDQTIVLHTLRHSCLSNLFLQIMLAGLGDGLGGRGDVPWLGAMGRKKSTLLRRLFQKTALPREAMYAIASFAGHIDPTESLSTYIHFQDWIAVQYLRAQCTQLPLAIWASMEGISVDALMVRRSRHKRANGNLPAHLDSPRRLLAGLETPRPAGQPCASAVPLFPGPPSLTSALQKLPLEGVFCVLALAGRQMSMRAREHATGLPSAVFNALRTCALELAKMKSAHRDASVRRSRVLASRTEIRQRPKLAQRPQLDGLAPAIPRERSELEDARNVFAVAANVAKPIGLSTLEPLLAATSHSDSVVTLRRLDDLKPAVSAFGALRIPLHRLRLEVRSLPKDIVNANEWIQRLAKESGLPPKQVRLATTTVPATKSAKTHPAGMLALRIESASRATDSVKDRGSNADPRTSERRLSYGWRVGLYYAVCVRRAVSISETG